MKFANTPMRVSIGSALKSGRRNSDQDTVGNTHIIWPGLKNDAAQTTQTLARRFRKACGLNARSAEKRSFEKSSIATAKSALNVSIISQFPWMNALTFYSMTIVSLSGRKICNPKTFWDLFNVGTNVLSHNMNRSAESTHNIETSLYNTMKKWALQSNKVASA